MKKRTYVLLLMLLLSTLAVAGYGSYLKYGLCEPLGVMKEENIISLPFVSLKEPGLFESFREQLRYEETRPSETEGTEPTQTEATQATAPSTEPSVEPTQPPTEPSQTPSDPTMDTATEPSAQPTDGPSSDFTFNRTEFALNTAGLYWDVYNGTVPVDQIQFRSDNPAVATFVAGRVTAVGEGTTKVHATYNGQTLTCIVYCKWKTEETQPTTPPVTNPPTTAPTTPPETTPSETTPSETTPPETQPPETQPPYTGGPYVPSSPLVDLSYFDDVLFIGNSQWVGLQNYAPLGNADYYCTVGMSVFNVSYSELGAKLAAKNYGKVYIGLGINECGYGLESIISNYSKLISFVQQNEPGVQVVINGIMTTGRNKAAEASYFQPSNIERINNRLRNLANGSTVLYFHTNEAFADSQGYLYDGLSADGCHLYAKYYALWAQFMRYKAATT